MKLLEKSFLNNLDDSLIVCDIDEVIVNITPKWVNNAYADPDLRQFITPAWEKTDVLFKSFEEAVLNRNKYYLSDWMEISRIGSKHLMRVFFGDENFYDDIEPSKLGRGILEVAQTYKDSFVFLSHTIEDSPVNKSKIRFLERYAKGLNYYLIDSSVPKSEFIKENDLDVDIFIDDRFDIIHDVLKNTDGKNRDFIYVPNGYNLEFIEQYGAEVDELLEKSESKLHTLK